MKQEIEIEFKNLLTETEFNNIKQIFNLSEKEFKLQENHYFDTPNFSLKEHGAALRIRMKNDKYVLTLKQPATEGLLETHEQLTSEEAKHALQTNELKQGEITSILANQFNIPASSLMLFGSLCTNRAEVTYKEGLLVLDHSRYLSKEDYELEYEVKNFDEGKENFLKLLKELNISVRKTDNKIKRFYNEKFNRSSN